MKSLSALFLTCSICVSLTINVISLPLFHIFHILSLVLKCFKVVIVIVLLLFQTHYSYCVSLFFQKHCIGWYKKCTYVQLKIQAILYYYKGCLFMHNYYTVIY